VTKIAIPEGQCYWCRQRPANSCEHKFKRSDLVREHGRGELRGERTMVKYGAEGSLDIRSTKSGALKFRPSLCAECNNARSQQIDEAYDRFIGGVIDPRGEDLGSARDRPEGNLRRRVGGRCR
jgi:hypothetical protein